MSDNNEKLILGQNDAVSGGRIRAAIDGDPRLKALIDKLSPDEARALGGILSDPEKLRAALSSPQARKALEKARNTRK